MSVLHVCKSMCAHVPLLSHGKHGNTSLVCLMVRLMATSLDFECAMESRQSQGSPELVSQANNGDTSYTYTTQLMQEEVLTSECAYIKDLRFNLLHFNTLTMDWKTTISKFI